MKIHFEKEELQVNFRFLILFDFLYRFEKLENFNVECIEIIRTYHLKTVLKSIEMNKGFFRLRLV